MKVEEKEKINNDTDKLDKTKESETTNIKEKTKVTNQLVKSSITTPIKQEEQKQDILNQNYIPQKHSDVLSLLGFFCFIFILVTIITVCLFMLLHEHSKKIIRGVSINGIDVSGLTKESAKEEIEEYIHSSMTDEIKLTHNDFETSISKDQLSINYDVDKTIETAYNIGRDGNIFEDNINTIKAFFSPINIEIKCTIDEDQLKNSLNDISNKLPDKVIEASCYMEDNNLILTKGSKGSVVKIDESANYIKSNIESLNIKNHPLELITETKTPTEIDLEYVYTQVHKDPVDAYYTQNPYSVYPSENGVDFAISLEEAKNLLKEDKEEIVVPLKVVYPNVTTNMIGTEAFPDMLSQFSTNYAASNKNRTTNLILAANKINGTVLMPGEVFSYNTVVGARTIAAGYKEAPIYVSGKVEDGLGGGICQITSTLYNAVLYANLEIVERSNHQFVPSYASASRDATVVYGAIDFKFKNNREYPIKITCSVAGGVANFKIFGLKTENDYDVEISSRVTGSTATAIYSEAYKTLKKNGTIVSTEVISKDTYKRH